MRQKIIHIDSEKSWRGGQQQAIYLFEELLQKKFETVFFCKPNSRLHDYLLKKKYPFRVLPLLGEFDLYSAYRIARYAKKNYYSILCLHSSHALSIGILAKLFYPKLKLIGIRRVDFHIKNNLFSQVKYKSKWIDRIVAISQNIKNVLTEDQIPPEKINVIRSGIDIAKFPVNVNSLHENSFRKKNNIPENALLVGTIAALAGHKDYPTLLLAAKEVIEENGRVFFIAAGDGKDKEPITRLANELDLGDRFQFLGYRSDIGVILRNLDLFVLASKKEGLGTSTLDAMSVGLPVIGTDAGGIPEVIKHNFNGLIVPKKKPIALAKAMLELLADPKKRVQFGNNSLERVKEFSKEKMALEYIALYEQLSDF